MRYNQPNISLPQGVKDSLPDEARKITIVEQGIISVLEKCGFKRIITPYLEYLDVLCIGLGTELKDKVFKFIDPVSGKVVAIRPDITPQIARIVATRMRDCALPLKICYSEKVLRYQEHRSGKPREIQQIGAELITKKPSYEADAEILTAAINALIDLGIKDFKIDIGNVGFVKAVLDNLKLDDKDKATIKDAIALKDRTTLETILDKLGNKLTNKHKKTINIIPSLFGRGKEVIELALSNIINNKQAKIVAEDLLKLLNTLETRGLKKFITIDLSEIRGFDYYTGIIFEGFANGVGKAIMTGGRYDNLMQRYGYPCAAVGFAFDVENIVTVMEG